MSKESAEDSFRTFVDERSGRLQRAALAICADHQLAQDYTQEALARAFLKWNRITAKGDPYWYVQRILVNRIIDDQRRRKLREVPYDSTALAAPAPDATARVADSALVSALLADLPLRQRAVLALRYLEDLSEAEVASVLGMPLGTVKSTCSRALQRLRALLPPGDQPPLAPTSTVPADRSDS